jgi:hypothetical protein
MERIIKELENILYMNSFCGGHGEPGETYAEDIRNLLTRLKTIKEKEESSNIKKLTIQFPDSEYKKLRSALSVKRIAGKFDIEDRVDSLALALLSAIEQGKKEILLKERK